MRMPIQSPPVQRMTLGRGPEGPSAELSLTANRQPGAVQPSGLFDGLDFGNWQKWLPPNLCSIIPGLCT